MALSDPVTIEVKRGGPSGLRLVETAFGASHGLGQMEVQMG